MTTFIFANNVNTTLAGNVSTSATSITLSSTANLPASIPAGSVLAITLNDQATRGNYEVIYATAVTGATLSGLLRAQEGTAALAWLTGDFAFSGPTAGQQGSFGQLSENNTWTGTNTFDDGIAVIGSASATTGFVVPNNVPYQLTSTTGPFSYAYCTPANQIVVGTNTFPLLLQSASGGSVFGLGQTQRTVSLNYNTVYTNNTNAPIMTSCATSSTGAGSIGIFVGGVEVTNSTAGGSGVALCVWAVVFPGITYQYVPTGSVSGTATFTEWR